MQHRFLVGVVVSSQSLISTLEVGGRVSRRRSYDRCFMPAPLEALVVAWKARHFPPLPGRWVVVPGARAYALAGLAHTVSGPMFVVVPGERDAEDLSEDLALFTGQSVLMPAWETLPFEHLSPNAATMARRARARHRLQTGGRGTIVVASVRAAVQRLSPSDPNPLVFEKGKEFEISELTRHLAAFGYQRTDRVEARGEFAVRGGIVDLYPAQDDDPVRIDFWGDEVEDLRVFGVGDQRSADPVPVVEAFPAREFRPSSGPVVDRAKELLASDPWNASVWDRLVDGNHFSGMESWMPWLADERTVFGELSGRHDRGRGRSGSVEGPQPGPPEGRGRSGGGSGSELGRGCPGGRRPSVAVPRPRAVLEQATYGGDACRGSFASR